MRYKKRLSFGKITFDDLETFVDIREVVHDAVFDDWFGFPYRISAEEIAFLTQLIEANRRFLDNYLEEELKAQFIIPLLNKVDFFYHEARGWYERPLRAVINGVRLQGKTDYMVARGIETPKTPYFFIQEYKKEFGDHHPKNPLLAEMLAALQANRETLMRGAYVIGRMWTFMILRQCEDNRYEYFRSTDFSVAKLPELQAIYVNLQAIKALL